jgi:hypothetical protein
VNSYTKAASLAIIALIYLVAGAVGLSFFSRVCGLDVSHVVIAYRRTHL